MKVAFQGEPGAYSEEACRRYFGQVETVPCESFDDIFAAVVAGICESGLVPIENSLAGSVHQNYDLLLRHQLSIVGEYFLRVQHCLIAFPGVTKTEIKQVMSHPQALGQCAAYLRRLGRTQCGQKFIGRVDAGQAEGDADEDDRQGMAGGEPAQGGIFAH